MMFDPSAIDVAQPRRNGERLWNFLERSPHPEAAEIRDELTGWLSGITTSSERHEFVHRLRADDDRLVESTHTELALFTLMRQLPYGNVETNAKTPSGGRTDIYLTDTGVHIEVLRLSSSDRESSADKRRLTLVESFEKVDSPDFWIDILDVKISGESPSIRRLRGAITDWLASLDYDTERRALEEQAPNYEGPSKIFSGQGWQFELRAMAKSPAHRGNTPTVGAWDGGVALTRGFNGIKDAIAKKLAQHSGLTSPLVVALDITRSITSRDEIEAALYGPTVDDRTGPLPRFYRARRDCIWPEWNTTRRPAAVMVINDLRMGQPWRATWELWLPPGGKSPLPHGPWSVYELDPNEQNVNETSPLTKLPPDFERPLRGPHKAPPSGPPTL